MKIRRICPVCKSTFLKKYVEKEFENIKSTWFTCLFCGTIFIWPRVEFNELAKYYKKDYKLKKCQNFVSHLYRFSEENKKRIFNEYALSLKDVSITPEELKHKKILDYGCANGFFLDFLVEHGCFKKDLYGFDIAEDLLHEVINKGYTIISNEKGFFDLIFLWDVLEHISDPDKIFKKLTRLLKKGGMVVVQTPRVGILSELFGSLWEHLLVFEHVVLYSRESLKMVFRKYGFVLKQVNSFGANCPVQVVPEPYKSVYDKIVKLNDSGSTQVGCFELR